MGKYYLTSLLVIWMMGQIVSSKSMRRVVDRPDGCAATWRCLDKKWTSNNLMDLRKGKCKILHLDKINPTPQKRLGGEQLESSAAENDLTWWTPNFP